MAADSWRHLYDKNNSCHPVTHAWFSIQILVNFEIFKTLMKYFLKAYYRAIIFQFITGNLSRSKREGEI